MKRYKVGDILVCKQNNHLYKVYDKEWKKELKRTIYHLKKLNTCLRISIWGGDENFDRANIAAIRLSRTDFVGLHSGPRVKFKYTHQFDVFRTKDIHLLRFASMCLGSILARFETVNFMVSSSGEKYMIITDLDLIR